MAGWRHGLRRLAILRQNVAIAPGLKAVFRITALAGITGLGLAPPAGSQAARLSAISSSTRNTPLSSLRVRASFKSPCVAAEFSSNIAALCWVT